HALLGITTDLFAVGTPGALEALFNLALQRIEHAPDLRIGVVLMIWHNLAVLYDRHGAHELRQNVVDQIGHVAAHYTGPVGSDWAPVLEHTADVAESSGNVDFMLTLLAQAHRYWSGNPGIDAQQRAQW